MALPLSTRQPSQPALPPRTVRRAMAMVAGALGAVLLLGALILWLHYGTAVFFEMVASGFASCF